MKIRILPSALNDLAKGRRFYERQGEGLGSYFLNTLYSDIDSLARYAGIHLKVGNIIALSLTDFRMRFTIASATQASKCGVCWTAGKTRAKSDERWLEFLRQARTYFSQQRNVHFENDYDSHRHRR